MDSSKLGRWIGPFKKFSRLRFMLKIKIPVEDKLILSSGFNFCYSLHGFH